MGHVQKEDIDEAARKGSGEGIFHILLRLDDIKIECVRVALRLALIRLRLTIKHKRFQVSYVILGSLETL